MGPSSHEKKSQAVVFDVFGTLLRIGVRKKPFLNLMKLAREMGRRPTPLDARLLMTEDIGVVGAAELLGIRGELPQLAIIEKELFCELSTVELFPDSLPAIRMLQAEGIQVAVCSNLAAPYAIPAKLLLPGLDAYCWSFASGAIKPEPDIYTRVADQLNCPLSRLIMIGDTLEADCLAPRRCGMQGFHLIRNGRADQDTFTDLVSFAEFVLSSHR
ncbi:HAD family hydrolase [Pseudomonas aeruginosa]|uniref:HAD family hydrolase n=1 Tax=Pseudomonas aeruginosa TaxID=287 RepID=UPI0015E38A59|nr:HAD family hydrolase [Pseudomonas aeruginosa]MBA1286453.1 HAD family hydrolase [Pseudomonas aeruginosa]